MACVVGGLAYWICDLFGLEAFICQIIGGSTVLFGAYFSC